MQLIADNRFRRSEAGNGSRCSWSIVFENHRQAKIVKREKNNFWSLSPVEEQIIAGINDFNY